MNTKEITKLPVKRVTVNGTNLAYIEQGSGEPVIFIHGAISDFRTWLDQFETFSKDYRVISYSRRSHYPNAPEEGDYTRERHKTDLVEFLRALKIEKAHLIGHSYGAAIALMAARDNPELVASLVLGEPSPFPALFDAGEGAWLLAEQKKGFREALRLAQNGEREAAAREFLRIIVGVDVLGLLPEERRAVVLENAGTLRPMLRNYYDSTLGGKELKKVKTPALLMTGELSPAIARFGNKMIGHYLPNSRIAVLKGASHGLQIENPEGFDQLVGDFLAAPKNTAKLSNDEQLCEALF